MIIIGFQIEDMFIFVEHQFMKIAPNLLNLNFDEGIQLTSQYTNTHFIFDSWISDTSEEKSDKKLQGQFESQDTRERIKRNIEMVF